ncbi:hypothetical protein [Streptosporangium sp. NBC_01469]|uniref:hypothetical protein n=1 Tax=Streptosporangium sp. NBC_01469 TaxID=2903898 RepID=UPI002E2A9C53|nr:hypothetical protein [Streptosporangium sp. NBC_01469]
MAKHAEDQLIRLRRPKWHLQAIRIRKRFIYSERPAKANFSGRTLPPVNQRPPAARLISPRGIALRFYLTLLYEAQMFHRGGGHPINRRPLIAGGAEIGWTDLITISPITPYSRIPHSIAERKRRTIVSALSRLSSEEVQLISLPRREQSYAKYEGFQILDEGGVRPDGGAIPYLVPRKSEHHIAIPCSFFENGWIHALEDSEILFLLMLLSFLQGEAYPPFLRRGRYSPLIKVDNFERLSRFGVGRDTYAAHETLQMFNLVATESGLGRRPDGTVIKFNGMIGGDSPLHEFRLLLDGFERPAEEVVIGALSKLLN